MSVAGNARRAFLRRAGIGVAAVLCPALGRAREQSTLAFEEVAEFEEQSLTVPPGHRAQVLLRWGDPLFPDAPAFDAAHQTATHQARQFGYNNDFVAFMPLPRDAPGSEHGLLFVGHEYPNPFLMFPDAPWPDRTSRAQMDIEMNAVGASVVEINRGIDDWRTDRASRFNRRITASTPVRIAGPAAGHRRMRTAAFQDGTKSMGTIGNCAGGVTPWGTILSGEENVQYYFIGDAKRSPESLNYRRFGFERHMSYQFYWGRHYDHWNMDREPRAPLHYGWIVEIDPYAPGSAPVKRTALGRFRHEGCGAHVNGDGRVVLYMGDDERNEYIYRFVSAGHYEPQRPETGRDLLDDGTLSVARFHDDGRVEWLPLVHGRPPLNAGNGFVDQGDVVIDARKAADLVGATPMDRPEELEVNPVTGTVFVMLTGNKGRLPGKTNAANPRPFNLFGHIIEMVPPNGDHSADEFKWNIFLLAGNPANPLHGARYHPAVSAAGWFSGPDNCAFDRRGRLWIATDGSHASGRPDGLFACEVTGSARALTRCFLRAPLGAEVTGPCFTPDNTTLFCSIQHPGEESVYGAPSTRWPDNDPRVPPRPAVVAIRRTDGAAVGG